MIKALTFALIISSISSTFEKLHCSDWVVHVKGFTCREEQSLNPKVLNHLTFFVYKNNEKYLMKMSVYSKKAYNELQILKNVQKHEYISQLVAQHFEVDKFVLYVVKFGELQSLEEFIISKPDYFRDFGVLMGFFKKLVTGVKNLHAEGFVHANLKPTSIFVDGNMDPVIFDFEHSLYKNRSGLITNNSSPIMSPEMKASIDFDKKIDFDEKIDVFFLGMLLLELYKGSLSKMMNLHSHYRVFLESRISFSKGDPKDFYNLIFKSIQTNFTRLSFTRYVNLVKRVADYPSAETLEEDYSYQISDFASEDEKNFSSVKVNEDTGYKSSIFDNTVGSEAASDEVEVMEELHHEEEHDQASLLTEILLVIFFINWFLFFGLIFVYVLYVLNSKKYFDFLIEGRKNRSSEEELESVVTSDS